jgi:hypothetical protein
MRPDQARFAQPGASTRRVGDDHVQVATAPTRQVPREAVEAWSRRSVETEIPALKWSIAALRFQRAWLRQEQQIQHKAGFDPNQPRDDRGRWTDTGASLDPPPEIPAEKPLTAQLRNRIIKQAAIWLAKAAARETVAGPVVGTFLNVLDAALWIRDGLPYVQAYLDEPKSLEELQQAVTTPARGYDKHHIVEQTPAEKYGFSRSLIDSPDNLVRIPTLKHWEITGWYMTKNKDYGGLTPREYLQDKDWDERTRVGRNALIDHGVLKP